MTDDLFRKAAAEELAKGRTILGVPQKYKKRNFILKALHKGKIPWND